MHAQVANSCFLHFNTTTGAATPLHTNQTAHLVHVQQLYVVAHVASAEGPVRVLSVHRLVFWPVEDCAAYGHHGTDGGHLLRYLRREGAAQKQGKHRQAGEQTGVLAGSRRLCAALVAAVYAVALPRQHASKHYCSKYVAWLHVSTPILQHAAVVLP
jgi:hypothetical protein